ncbi:MAG TPA: hypothetical protein DCW74_18410 [Alteromonas australica]|uniref:Uncharacterized protein n=1 Tax=Alteromonas australica TaxID=589873 RepID=A0A350P8S7_9ALTE|nr:hypothetical protein [Alteromonas australica]
MNIKEITDILQSIDVSLQTLANAQTGVTTTFISKKAIAAKLGVGQVVIDKLIHQGIHSRGESGLVEGRHYCKLDPKEANTRYFLFDASKVMADAWKSFSGYDTESREDCQSTVREERSPATSFIRDSKIDNRGHSDTLSRVS